MMYCSVTRTLYREVYHINANSTSKSNSQSLRAYAQIGVFPTTEQHLGTVYSGRLIVWAISWLEVVLFILHHLTQTWFIVVMNIQHTNSCCFTATTGTSVSKPVPNISSDLSTFLKAVLPPCLFYPSKQRSVDVHPPNFFRTSKVLIHLTWSWLVQYASTSFIIHFHSLCYIPSVDGYLLFMANPPYCSSIFMLKLSSINPTFLMIHPCWPPPNVVNQMPTIPIPSAFFLYGFQPSPVVGVGCGIK